MDVILENTLFKIKEEIGRAGDAKRAEVFLRFFKTGKGEYGEGDKFFGLTVPKCRGIACKYKNLSLKEVEKLFHSKIHEERLISLLILVEQFVKGDETKRKEIFKLYLKNTAYINNWDLVDLSCYKIIGAYLFDKPRDILFTLAKSKNIWERRIAIVSTYWFIKHNQLDETLNISEILLSDPHDLIHKAAGWMLREVGKRSQKDLEQFLKENYRNIPRTTLRYAIERLPENLRKAYLSKKTLTLTPQV